LRYTEYSQHSHPLRTVDWSEPVLGRTHDSAVSRLLGLSVADPKRWDQLDGSATRRYVCTRGSNATAATCTFVVAWEMVQQLYTSCLTYQADKLNFFSLYSIVHLYRTATLFTPTSIQKS
jgi:hypothetical protein